MWIMVTKIKDFIMKLFRFLRAHAACASAQKDKLHVDVCTSIDVKIKDTQTKEVHKDV